MATSSLVNLKKCQNWDVIIGHFSFNHLKFFRVLHQSLYTYSMFPCCDVFRGYFLFYFYVPVVHFSAWDLVPHNHAPGGIFNTIQSRTGLVQNVDQITPCVTVIHILSINREIWECNAGDFFRLLHQSIWTALCICLSHLGKFDSEPVQVCVFCVLGLWWWLLQWREI